MHSHFYLALSEDAAFSLLDKHHEDNGEMTKCFFRCVQFSESKTAVGSLSVSELIITHKKMCVDTAVVLKEQHQHSVPEAVALKWKH